MPSLVLLLPCPINIYKYSNIYVHTYVPTASPLVVGIHHHAVPESCGPATREHCHPDIPLQCATSSEPLSCQPVDSQPPLPPSRLSPFERRGAVLAAVWFSDHYQSCCLLAENKTHFWTMGNSVSSAGLCSLWRSGDEDIHWDVGVGKGLAMVRML